MQNGLHSPISGLGWSPGKAKNEGFGSLRFGGCSGIGRLEKSAQTAITRVAVNQPGGGHSGCVGMASLWLDCESVLDGGGPSEVSGSRGILTSRMRVSVFCCVRLASFLLGFAQFAAPLP